jgi:hypothetical protein
MVYIQSTPPQVTVKMPISLKYLCFRGSYQPMDHAVDISFDVTSRPVILQISSKERTAFSFTSLDN